MCTVTLLPKGKNSFILTSNRDEAIGRTTLPLEFYEEHGTRMLYPKDAVAGGTWIGVSDQHHLVCLLNGGFKNHNRQVAYRKSRGVVVKELLAAAGLDDAIQGYQCQEIEPFTIVAASWQNELRFFEMVWDGVAKHVKELPKKPKIWSSSTLYTPMMKADRLQWFEDFNARQHSTAATLLDFHKYAGDGHEAHDLVMDRGLLKTCSITQLHKMEEQLTMRYEDLQKQEVNTITFEAIRV